MNSFLNHFLSEYKYGGYYLGKNPLIGSWILNESNGLFPGVDEILDLIGKQLESNLSESSLEGDQVEINLYDTLKNHPDNFIGKESYLTVTIPDSGEAKRGGVYQGSGETEYDPATDTLKYADIDIMIKPLRIMSLEDVINEIKNMVAHEMIHAYEDYQRQKAGKEDMGTYISQTNYAAPHDHESIAVDLRMYTYLLHPVEQRAFIATLGRELRQLQQRGILDDDPRNISSMLEKTTFWRNYKYASNFVDVVKNIKTLTQGGQQRLLDAYNKVSPEQFRVGNIKALQRVVPRRWDKAMDYIKVRVAKQLASLYSEKTLVPTDDFS